MTACAHPRPAAFLSTFSRVARAGKKFLASPHFVF